MTTPLLLRASAVLAAALALAPAGTAAQENPMAPVLARGGLVYVSGVVARPEVRAKGIEAQTTDVLAQLDATLKQSGSSLARAVSTFVQLRQASDFAAMNTAYAKAFTADPPARTTVVAASEAPDALVEISVVAAAAGTSREVIRPADWKPSPNPYSYGVKAGGLVFLSGLVSRDGRTNEMVAGDITAQVDAIFANAEAILKAAGLGLGDIVNTKVFLTDGSQVGAMNTAYKRRMPTPRPTRATVVTPLMGPQYLVEMTFIAAANKTALQVGPNPTDPDATFSPAITAAGRTFLSGIIANQGDSIEDETRNIVARLGEGLKAAGLDWSHVVDSVVYVTDIKTAAAVRKAWQDATGKPLPTGSTVHSGLVVPKYGLEIIVSAVKP